MKETWQERLQRFEAKPPARVWDRVEEALEQDPASVAERLQAFSAPPPAGLWDRIERALDEPVVPEEAPVKALPRQQRSFFAYAAAAALIGAILVSTAILLNRNHQAPALAVHTEQPAAPAQAPAPLSTAETPPVAPPSDNSVAVTAPAGEAAPARTTTSPASTTAAPAEGKPAAVAVPANTYASASLARNAPVHAATAIDEDRYLVRSYNNGNTVRFSKKVSAVVDCAEHSTGFSQSLCKVSIGAVQEKVALSVGTDFGGLIERLQDLETSK